MVQNNKYLDLSSFDTSKVTTMQQISNKNYTITCNTSI